MEFWTLDEYFQPQDVIDGFISAIWTERYGKSGDVSIVTEPTDAMLAALVEGTYLNLVGSTETMQIDSALIEGGVLKVSGKTLDSFLNTRIIFVTAYNTAQGWPVAGKAGYILGQIVNYFCIAGSGSSRITNQAGQIIPNLSLGAIDSSGSDILYTVPFGDIYPALEQLAETYSLGFSLYVYSITPPATYSLKFKVWKGRDLTSDQSTYPVVKFSPDMDTLSDVKSLRSIANFRNVAYVYTPQIGEVDLGITVPTAHQLYIPKAVDNSLAGGLDRRIMYVIADDVLENGATAANFLTIYNTDAKLYDLEQKLIQRGKDALANNNYTKMVDGQAIPQGYTYGVDYLLGDIVELDAYGFSEQARITEYIRSQDKEGERAYPTVSVI